MLTKMRGTLRPSVLLVAMIWNDSHCDAWILKNVIHSVLPGWCSAWPSFLLLSYQPMFLKISVFLHRRPGIEDGSWALQADLSSHLDSNTCWLWNIGQVIWFPSLFISSLVKCFSYCGLWSLSESTCQCARILIEFLIRPDSFQTLSILQAHLTKFKNASNFYTNIQIQPIWWSLLSIILLPLAFLDHECLPRIFTFDTTQYFAEFYYLLFLFDMCWPYCFSWI